MSSLDVQKDTDDYLLRDIHCTQAYAHSAVVRTESLRRRSVVSTYNPKKHGMRLPKPTIKIIAYNCV